MSNSVWYLSVSKEKIEFKKYPAKKKKKKTIKKSNQKSTNSSKKLLINLILASSLIFFLNVISAAPINDTFHINLQTTYANGSIETGTFTLTFNITESSNPSCLGPIVYNHSTSKTTDTRGIVSLYLPTTGSGGGSLSTLNYDTQYYLCYYRDGTLKNVSQLGRVPYAFRATQVNLSEISVDSNLTLGSYNVSASSGFFSFLGSLVQRITKIFAIDADISNNLDVGGDINVTGSVFSQNKNLTLGYEYAINYTGTAGIGDCPSGQFVQNTTTGGVECDAPAGAGDITGVFTTLDDYLYNGSASGDVYLRFNETFAGLNLAVNASDYWDGYDTPSEITSGDSQLLDGYDSTFFMPLNTSVVGTFDFNGGWTSGGLSIDGGDLYAQTVYVYNITSLNVTEQDLTIIDDLIVYSNNDRVGINTTTPQNTLNVVGDANITGLIYGNGSQLTGISTTETDPFWTANQSNYYNKTYVYNTTTIDAFSLSYWTDDLGDRGYTSLTNFTDNLGNRGYTHLTNFTDDILWTSGFNSTGDDRWLGVGGETDPFWATFNKTYADTLYILQSNEANLNVNSSNYWDGYDTPSEITSGDSQLLDGYDSGFFMPLNTSVVGTFDFNGGWTNGGLSIDGGDLYAQTVYVYNITSLNVTEQDLTIIDDLIVYI
jgi:hypothetical protein